MFHLYLLTVNKDVTASTSVAVWDEHPRMWHLPAVLPISPLPRPWLVYINDPLFLCVYTCPTPVALYSSSHTQPASHHICTDILLMLRVGSNRVGNTYWSTRHTWGILALIRRNTRITCANIWCHVRKVTSHSFCSFFIGCCPCPNTSAIPVPWPWNVCHVMTSTG